MCGIGAGIAKIEDLDRWWCRRCGGGGDATTYAVLEELQGDRGAERLRAIETGCRAVGVELPRPMSGPLTWIARQFMISNVAASFIWRPQDCLCCESERVSTADEILWDCGDCGATGMVVTFAAILALASQEPGGLDEGVKLARRAADAARAAGFVAPRPAPGKDEPRLGPALGSGK